MLQERTHITTLGPVEASTSQQIVTPVVAAEWLQNNNFPRQRPLKKGMLDSIAKSMIEGRFVRLTQIRFAIYQDRYILVDGQHRLSAVVKSGIAQPFVVTYEPMDTWEEVERTYAGIDMSGGRTETDRFKAFGLDEEYGLKVAEITAMARAVRFAADGFVRGTAKVEFTPELLQKLDIYAPYMRKYLSLIAGSRAEMYGGLRRVPTLSVALLTLRYDDKPHLANTPSAEDFWIGAAMDDGLRLTDQRKHVHDHILTKKVISDMLDNRGSGNSVSQQFSSRFIIAFYNAYMKQRVISRTMIKNPSGPVDIHGVPNNPDVWWT